MSEIDLNLAVDEALEEITLEKKAEVKKKIRWVADQIARFESEERKIASDLEKMKEKLAKARGKLDELRKGNWNILSQINMNEREEVKQPG